MKRYVFGMLLAGLMLFTGCTKQEEIPVSTAKTVSLRAIILGNAPDAGLEELYEQLDALTIPELNCTLRFEYIPWGNEREQLNIAIASGEYDFIPGGVFSDYRTLISKNAFLNLADYLYLVPELEAHYATYSETALKDCEIDGGLYGIPQFGPGEIKNVNEGFFYREDLRKEWGLPEITDLASMEAYLYRAKEEPQYRDEPLITDNRIWQSLWLLVTKGKYLEISSMQETPFVVAAAGEPDIVLNRLELPEFQEVLAYIKKWRDDGILESDLLVMSDNEGEYGKNLMLQDKKPCETNVPIWSASSSHVPALTEKNPDWEFGFFSYLSVNDRWYIGSLANASVISVSVRTTEPETAVRLLEKIHTDQRYYDLMKYGVEGIHYTLEDDRISYDEIPGGDRFTWSVCTDELMNREEVPINTQWDQVVTSVAEWSNEISKEALEDPLEGFTFLPKGLNRELTAMEEVRLKYFQPLVCGYTEDTEAGLQKACEELSAAGLEAYVEEMEKQIQAWKKSE